MEASEPVSGNAEGESGTVEGEARGELVTTGIVVEGVDYLPGYDKQLFRAALKDRMQTLMDLARVARSKGKPISSGEVSNAWSKFRGQRGDTSEDGSEVTDAEVDALLGAARQGSYSVNFRETDTADAKAVRMKAFRRYVQVYGKIPPAKEVTRPFIKKVFAEVVKKQEVVYEVLQRSTRLSTPCKTCKKRKRQTEENKEVDHSADMHMGKVDDQASTLSITLMADELAELLEHAGASQAPEDGSVGGGAGSEAPKSQNSAMASSSPEKRLEGKVAIITGGASGIGLATAKLFASHGAKVVIADIQDDAGARVAEELGADSRYVHCDVSSEEQVSSCISSTIATFGKLDIMFNNAGVVNAGAQEQALQGIPELDSKVFDHILDVNMKGVFYGVKHASKAMIASGNPQGCSILNTCSIVAVAAQRASHAYTISKHAVLGITKTASSELGKHGIRVNCISPAVILTPLALDVYKALLPGMSGEEIGEAFVANSELGGTRLEMEDVANAALFLSSREAKFISGHNLVLDGGFTAARPSNPLVNPYS